MVDVSLLTEQSDCQDTTYRAGTSKLNATTLQGPYIISHLLLAHHGIYARSNESASPR